jgi:hypothetical protein
MDNLLTTHEQQLLFINLLREIKEINEKNTILITIIQEQNNILQSQQRHLQALNSSIHACICNTQNGSSLSTLNR